MDVGGKGKRGVSGKGFEGPLGGSVSGLLMFGQGGRVSTIGLGKEASWSSREEVQEFLDIGLAGFVPVWGQRG